MQAKIPSTDMKFIFVKIKQIRKNWKMFILLVYVHESESYVLTFLLTFILLLLHGFHGNTWQ